MLVVDSPRRETLTIDTTRSQHFTHITCSGATGDGAATRLIDAVWQAVEERPVRRLVLDLSGVNDRTGELRATLNDVARLSTAVGAALEVRLGADGRPASPPRPASLQQR